MTGGCHTLSSHRFISPTPTGLCSRPHSPTLEPHLTFFTHKIQVTWREGGVPTPRHLLHVETCFPHNTTPVQVLFWEGQPVAAELFVSPPPTLGPVTCRERAWHPITAVFSPSPNPVTCREGAVSGGSVYQPALSPCYMLGGDRQ